VLPESAGLTPRVFDYLFHRITAVTAAEPGTSFVVRASFYEIYNEVIIDLLGRASNLAIRRNLRSGTVYVEGVEQCEVYCLSDVMALITRGLANRTVAETQMNATSSRSHCILSCVIESKTMEDGVGRLKAATLNLVDLAGSERQARTAAAGLRLKEASSINKSLSTLGHVIMSLVQGSPHVPYRDSKLTHILQDSLGGNAKAVMIAAVSPSAQNAAETESTLGFAARARRMKNNAVVNEDAVGDVAQLRKENVRLRKELDAFRLLETTNLTSKVVKDNERLRGELAAALAAAAEEGVSRCSSSSCSSTSAVAVDLAVVEADGAFNVWEKDAAVELLERQLKEVLETNVVLEKRVDELSESNAKLRTRQASLSMENSTLRISAELVAEFNAAFQRATAEADKANARVAELESELEDSADKMRYERHSSREEMLDKELLLQEFSELTKMLAEAVRERDQAISDRDAALAQKLNMSRRKQHTEEQLDDIIRKKTVMQEQLSSILDGRVNNWNKDGNGKEESKAVGSRQSGSDDVNLSVRSSNGNTDLYRAHPSSLPTEPKDPFLRIIIQKLEGMERTRSASLPGTPTAACAGSPPPQRLGTPRSALVSVLRERDAAMSELEALKVEHTKALHALKQASLGNQYPHNGDVYGMVAPAALAPMYSTCLDMDEMAHNDK
jgi:kinesin family protein 15